MTGVQTCALPISDGVQVQLNGAASTDPDNDNLTYGWKVDGQEVGFSAIIDLKLGIGAHIITLSVNDGRGGVGTATVNIEVLPPPPPPAPALTITSVSPSRIARDSAVVLQITGTGFSPQANVYISGSGVSALTIYSRSDETITVYVRAQSFASAGPRDVIVANPDGQTAILRGALTVQF